MAAARAALWVQYPKLFLKIMVTFSALSLNFSTKKAPDDGSNLQRSTIVVPDMHTQAEDVSERSDAFVTLPGGIGTIEEIVEILTWAQLGRHDKPMVFANINHYWAPMIGND